MPLDSSFPHCLLSVHFLLIICSCENSIFALHCFLCPPKMQPPAVVIWHYCSESSCWYVRPKHLHIRKIWQEENRTHGTWGEKMHWKDGTEGCWKAGAGAGKRGERGFCGYSCFYLQVLREELSAGRRRQQQQLPQLVHRRTKSMSAN